MWRQDKVLKDDIENDNNICLVCRNPLELNERIMFNKDTEEMICIGCWFNYIAEHPNEKFENLPDDTFLIDENIDTEIKENQMICDKCNCIVDIKHIIKFDKEYYCPQCANYYIKICPQCGIQYHKDNNVMSPVTKMDLCRTCFEKTHFICDNCGKKIVNKLKKEEGIVTQCYKCFLESKGIFHNHNFERKNIEFFNTDEEIYFNKKMIFLGIEIETEHSPCDKFTQYTVIEELNKKYGHFLHTLWDGSLRKVKDIDDSCDGFEIVTQPATLTFLKKNYLKDILSYLVHNNFTSFQSGRCGLHIHIDRAFFDDEERYKMAFFILNNKFNMMKIARRTGSKYSMFYAKKVTYLAMKRNFNKIFCDKKYIALNFQHPNTIEFRFFRGTLNKFVFFSILEFVDSVSRFIKIVPQKDLRSQKKSWNAYCLYVEKTSQLENNYIYLKTFLKNKDLWTI